MHGVENTYFFFRLLHVKLTLDLLVSFRRESRARKYQLWKQGALKAAELLWYKFWQQCFSEDNHNVSFPPGV